MEKSKTLLLMLLVLAVVVFTWGINPAFAGPGGGTFYANSPSGGASGKALRKFVDSLPGLGATHANNLGQYIPIAVPDTTASVNNPGGLSDYYEIGLRDYTARMHSDLLKATRLRGYYQINGPGTSSRYLGPLILATKDRPVRIKFFNQLSPGIAGNLFLPVDTTVMGAGKGPDGIHNYTQNRAVIHLHGGNTPWISDGTPHQWITPASETSTIYLRGMSQKNVPDMPDPDGLVQGSATYFWSNQQSGRLMFYHDHAYGTTRLNVYAGEVAGYLLKDPQEDTLINNGTIPGLTMPAEYRYGIPLIIQDKTFVPEDVDIQDSKWDTTHWGMPSDLWFPHVYEPNQNPAAGAGGVNPFGRWDYGPWFWPPVVVDPAHSVLPDPSITPEAFMDTMLVNGTAYPYLQVEPKAYRFRILNGSNDRMLNLQLYYADPTITSGPGAGAEIKMLPADPPTSSSPLQFCATATTMNDGGLAIAAIDGTGHPLNGTGLPANCWPTSWPTDGRDGGVPDPRTAGPAIIQIGTEGGLLPKPVVIPSTPVGYDYNRRNIVVLNVFNKALFLGPAERADIIIDFSSVPSGSKLVLYNDSPAPVPGFDPRYDYYTGNPDQTAGGGAPPTLAGFGPNTRTIMQFQVTGSQAAPFNLAALQTALPAAFNATQPAPLVPEVDYPAPNNATNNTYSKIQDTSLTFTPMSPIGARPLTMRMLPKTIQELWDPYGRMNATLGVELPFTNNNIQTTIPLGYIDPVTEIVPDGQPQLWKITHNGVDTHAVHFHLYNVQVINRVGWDGQIRPPEDNELGWKETVRMHPLEDIIVALQPKSQVNYGPPGLPFSVPDSIRPLDPTSPTTATLTLINPADGNAISVPNAMTNFGWEYVWHCHILGHEENDMMRAFVLHVPTVVPTAPVSLTPTLPAPVPPTTVASTVKLDWTGGLVTTPNEPIGFRLERCSGVGCSNFSPITTIYAGELGSITVTAPGTGYTSAPTVTFSGGSTGTGAIATATVDLGTGTVTGITLTNPGAGYITLPTVNITGGGGTGATAEANFAYTYTDTLVASNTTYNYRVFAFNAKGDSATASTATQLTPTWPAATGVTITPDQPSPHTVGTAVVITASGTVTGAVIPPYQYRFWLNNGTTNTMVQDYGVASTWTLPASTPVGSYTITVDVRTNPTSATPDATNTLAYQIIAPTAVSVAITPNVQFVEAGNGVLLTATGSGASGYQYQFWLNNGLTNTMVQDYGVGSAWMFPSTLLPGNYEVAVNMTVGNTITPIVASSSINFNVFDKHDFSADGKPDLLWRNKTTGDVAVWYMNGTALLSGEVFYHGVPLSWDIAGTGDFNNDGKPDILWHNKTTGDVSVWYMNGTNLISGASIYQGVPLDWETVGTGDFNGDGKPDILWYNKTTGDVSVWYMNGATLIGGASIYQGVPLAWEIVGTGDFNGIGKPDILWHNKATGDVSVWYMNGATLIGGASIYQGVPLAWEIVGTGDFNGDGKPDILWHNKTTGDVSVWYMDGATLITGAPIYQGVPLEWEPIVR